jgi:hypothetical protein
MQSSSPSDAAGQRLTRLSDDELEVALLRAQSAISAAEAARADVITELLRRTRSADSRDPANYRREEFVADHVAAVLSCTKAAANALLDTAVEASDHPSVMRAWRSGEIDSRKVGVIASGLRHVDRAYADSIAAQAITYGRTRTASQLRVWLDRRVLAGDPALAVQRRRRAMAARKVSLTPLADGMAELAAYLPAVQARQIYDTVNAAAMAAEENDRRAIDQRRCDALVDLIVGRAEPPQVNVNLVVTAETLLDSEAEPAWISGVGPVPADDAQQMVRTATKTTWRRLLADPDSGVLTDVGERSYRPSAKLDRAVRARDMTCRFPGCRRSATGLANGTDLDHTVPWPTGATAASNLAVLCRHHHRLKHSPGWSVTNESDGRMTCVTPGGRQIVTTPWEYIDRPPHPPD